jgi:hypothetical protein
MDEPERLPYNITNRKNGCKPLWRSQQLPVKARRLSLKKYGPLRISRPAIGFISRFLRTARLLCVRRTEALETFLFSLRAVSVYQSPR